MYKKLTKKAKILNLLTRGSKVTWTQLKNTYGLKSPKGYDRHNQKRWFCVYANKDTKGNTFYQIGKPSAAILKFGVAEINKISKVSYDTIIAGWCCKSSRYKVRIRKLNLSFLERGLTTTPLLCYGDSYE